MARPAPDDESQAILYQGANMSQLSTLFKADDRVLKEKMYGIKPVGKRSGHDIYAVHEVAARMGKLTVAQVDAAMKRLNHADLPKLLTKEYWAGKRSRQAFERDEGDLWKTSEIITHVGEMVKSLNMELNLLTDAIERQVEMTDRQRAIATQLIEGAKVNMLKALAEKFGEKEKPAKPKTLKPSPVVEDDDDEL